MSSRSEDRRRADGGRWRRRRDGADKREGGIDRPSSLFRGWEKRQSDFNGGGNSRTRQRSSYLTSTTRTGVRDMGCGRCTVKKEAGGLTGTLWRGGR